MARKRQRLFVMLEVETEGTVHETIEFFRKHCGYWDDGSKLLQVQVNVARNGKKQEEKRARGRRASR